MVGSVKCKTVMGGHCPLPTDSKLDFNLSVTRIFP